MRELWRLTIAGLVIGVIGGAALGVIWWRLAPRVSVVITPETTFPDGFQPSEFIAADVAYAGLAAFAGLIVVVGLLAMRRYHLLPVLFGSIVAGVVGSVLMWFVGTRLGHVDLEGLAATVSDEVVVEAPLRLRLTGLILLWPLVSAVVVTIVATWDWLVHLMRQKRSARDVGDVG